jgi:DNA-binding Lrp family transcriptional regulator
LHAGREIIRPKCPGDDGIICGGFAARPGATEEAMPESTKLDRIDINILAHLQRNGRITNVELAEAVALSPSPCLIRVKRLEKAGYIIGYNAHIDIAKLGETVTVFTQITLTDHHLEDFARFESGIRTVDEVIECHLISGGYDYLLKFMTRGIAHYQSLIENILERNIGITKYFSYIVIKSPIEKLHYPLAKLFTTER